MEEFVLKVNNVSKAYRLPNNTMFWALKDVSLTLKKGEILGIIGRNGDGKSTLLKVLSSIIKPSEGEIQICDKFASIIDVGSGLIPDLTGRENIIMYGKLLGFSNEDLRKSINEIINFSGLEDFIDLPLKNYSSGMYLRLAISVALHCHVPLLLIDEVLSVGDESFRKKVFKVISEHFLAQARTIVMASHNMNEIARICTRCIVLNKGEIVFDGKADDAINYYIETSATLSKNISPPPYIWHWGDKMTAPGNQKVKIHSFKITHGTLRANDQIFVDDEIQFVIEFWKLTAGINIHASILFSDQSDVPVFCATSILNGAEEVDIHTYKDKTGLFQLHFSIPPYFFSAGIYSCKIRFDESDSDITFIYDKNLNFKIFKDSQKISELQSAVLHPTFYWKYTKIE